MWEWNSCIDRGLYTSTSLSFLQPKHVSLDTLCEPLNHIQDIKIHSIILHKCFLWNFWNNLYLYLPTISSCDIWDCPACFFLDALFVIVGQQTQKAGERTIINNELVKTLALASRLYKAQIENIMKACRLCSYANMARDISSTNKAPLRENRGA